MLEPTVARAARPVVALAQPSRIFDGLSDEARAIWLEASGTRQLTRGEVVARQGEPARCLYVVESGALKLVQTSADGRDLIVRFVMAGEPFGGVVVLDGAEYPVTALAVEPTRLRAWPIEVLTPLLQRFPAVRMNVMREMAAHMTDALTRVRELATERVGARLAFTLLRLIEQCGRQTPEGVLIPHPLTRQELADLTGATLYTVSRTLAQWEADGVLRSSRRRLVVRAPERLAALTRGGS